MLLLTLATLSTFAAAIEFFGPFLLSVLVASRNDCQFRFPRLLFLDSIQVSNFRVARITQESLIATASAT